MNRCFKTVFNRALGVWQTTSELTTVAGKTSNKAVAVVVLGLLVSANSMAAGAINLPTAGDSYDMSGLGNQTVDTLSGVSGTTVSLGTNSLTFGNATSQTFAGVIDGTGSLVKNGTGVQTLSGINTFSGGMNFNAGTLVLGNNNALGTGPLNIGGMVALNSTIALSLNNDVNFGTGTFLTLTGSQNLTLGGVLAGSGMLYKNGASLLTLNGVNTFSGGVNITGGSLLLGNSSALGTGGLVVASNVVLDSLTEITLANSVSLNAGSSLTLAGSQNITFSGIVSGTGSLTKNGASSLTLTSANLYSGGTTINAGGLILGNNAALGTGSLTVGGNATLDASAAITVGNNIAINSGANLSVSGSNALTLEGPIVGGGGLVKNGAATLTLSNAETYTGGTTINAGTLALGGGGSLSATSSVNLANAGAGFDISGAGSQTIGALSGVAGSAISLGGNNLAFGTAANQAFNGSISGSGALIKNGSGMQTLGGASNFSGGVTVNAGGLVVGNTTALGSGVLTVGGAATLDASGPVALANNIMLNAGLTVVGSNDLTLNGNITGVGGLIKDGAATLTLNGSNTYTGGTAINAGTLALGAGASLSAGGIVNLASGATFDLSAGNGTQTFGTLVGNGTINLGANSLTIGGPTNGVFSGSIGGTGGLIKEGTGTATLTGTHTYTGGTLINAGTLAIDAGGSLASGGAVNLAVAGTGFDISAGGNQAIGQLSGVVGSTVTLGGSTLILGGIGNADFSGMLAGTGGLVKNGTGVQGLHGANNFSGGVALNSGGLLLGNNSALGTGALSVGGIATIDTTNALNVDNNVNLASGAALNFLGSNALTLSGVLSGIGGILKNGAATLTLTGVNSYTGGTTINAGTLAIGAGGSLATTGAVNLAGTGTLDISAGGNQTIGSLAGVTGSTVALGGRTMTFGGATDSAFNGSISGTGGLIKIGAGVQTLGGASGFSGGVTLNAGGLNLGNNTALGTGALTVGGASTLETSSHLTMANNVALNAGLSVLGSNNLNLNGILSGAGSLTKEGSGTLALNGVNTYTGGTTINAGTVRVNNANSGTFIVNNGGTLTGSGTVGNTTVANGATVIAESATLTINGDYQQSAGGVLRVDALSTAQYGKLDVTGIASFTANAKLDVDVKGSNTLAINNVLSSVISAGTLNASTFLVTDNSALFNFEAILNGDSVDLRVLSASSRGIQDAVTGQGFQSATGAANVLDGLLNGNATGDMATVVNALGQLSADRDVARAITQTLPVISGNQAVLGALSTVQNVVQNRNSNLSGGTGVSGLSGVSGGDAYANKNAWGKVFGSRAEQDDRSGASGFKADTWGLALGADAEVAPGTRFGMAYGYAKTSVNGNTNISGSAQRANIDSHIVSAYGSKDIGGNRTVSLQGDIGMNDSKSTRHIEFGGLSRTATADYRTYSAHVGAAIAQAFELNEKTTLTPALRADYTWLKSQSYRESGADALNLNVGSNKTDAFVIGADAYLQHRFSQTSRLDASFGVGYDTINKQGNIVAAYAGAPGLSFVTTGIDHSPWLVRGGIGYSVLASGGTEVSFRYDAEGRSDYLNHTASVRAKWAF